MKRIIVLVGLLVCSGYASSQQTLTLEECRNLAIQNNKELQMSGEKVKAANEERKAAFTKYFPQLSAMGGYMWNQKDINLLDMDALSAKLGSALGPLAQLPVFGQLMGGIDDVQHLDVQNIWVGGVSLVQPVFMGGKIVSYNQITKYARELAESMNDLQLQEVIYKTDETYWQAQTKVDNGLALSRMLLSQICGLPLDEPLALADENIENFPVYSSDATANVNEAFANRDELKSLELAAKIYQKKERIVLADMLPNVALSANYLVTNPNAFNGFKNEFAGMFNVGVMMKVPLSGWWEGTYKRNSARAETRIQMLQLMEAREKVELQVNQSVYKVNEANKKLTASSRNMENAEENLRHANLGFEEGVIPALNLMEAQTAWVSARSSLIDAQIEVKLTEVYLSKAMGKLSVDKQK